MTDDIAEIARGLNGARQCFVCRGTGKVDAYRGPERKIRCIFCDGSGVRAYLEAEGK